MFPVALQIHLELATSLLGLPYVWFVLPATALVFLAATGRVLVAKPRPRRALGIWLSSGYVILAALAGSFLSGSQTVENRRHGSVVADLVESYRQARGRWPADLHSVRRAGAELPTWRCGFLSHDFIYWLDTPDGPPQLKFSCSPAAGTFYSFERRSWYTSTL